MNETATPTTPQHQPADTEFGVRLARRRNDPILEELWAVKAKINAEANYDLDRIVQMAREAAAPFIGPDGRVRVPDGWPGTVKASEGG